MGIISIGNFTPVRNPKEMTVIRPEKATAVKQTYSGVAYFAWPATIVGKEIEILWPLMTVSDFAALDALYAADDPVTLDPNDGSGKTYTANLLALDGKYYIRSLYRSDVRLRLLIMAEVA